MDDEMKQKYQKYRDELLTGTLTDLTLKSISYQANIKLANDVIADQDKQLIELQKELNEIKRQLEESLNEKSVSENNRITILETDLKNKNDLINKLNSDILQLNKVKSENDILKTQSTNVETFRNQLLKERESHQQTRIGLETVIAELNQKIETLQNPPRRKRVVKQQQVNLLELATQDETVKDGGSF